MYMLHVHVEQPIPEQPTPVFANHPNLPSLTEPELQHILDDLQDNEVSGMHKVR